MTLQLVVKGITTFSGPCMQVDILVNNGGRSQRAWIKDTALDVDRDMVELNVLGQISLTKAVLPYMRERKSGLVMVNSSVTGKMGQ